MYVVRADGEKLYAKSGSLPGAQLPAMLALTLSQSGRTFNDAEMLLLSQAVTQAKRAAEANDYPAVALGLAELKRLGTLGQLSSFSQLAQEADALVADLVATQQTAINAAQQQTASVDSALQGLLSLVAYEDAFRQFPSLRKSVGEALKAVRQDAKLKDLLPLAESLQRARRYAASDSASSRRRAVQVYEQILRREPPQAWRETARKELAELSPSSPLLQPNSLEPSEGFRTWTDASGKFTIFAKLRGVQDGKVALQKQDGELVVLPLEKLSEADQKLLK